MPPPDLPPPLPNDVLGSRLRALRRDVLRLDQESLAQALGVGIASVSRWERGENGVPIEVLCRLAWHTGLSIDYLLRPEGTERVYACDSEHIEALRTMKRNDKERGRRPLWRELDAATRVLRSRREAMDLVREITGDDDFEDRI